MHLATLHNLVHLASQQSGHIFKCSDLLHIVSGSTSTGSNNASEGECQDYLQTTTDGCKGSSASGSKGCRDSSVSSSTDSKSSDGALAGSKKKSERLGETPIEKGKLIYIIVIRKLKFVQLLQKVKNTQYNLSQLGKEED